MRFLSVGKTVVAYSDKPDAEKVMFLLVDERSSETVRRRASLAELARLIRGLNGPAKSETWFIKNDVPAIVWIADDTLPDRVLECERLSRDEIRQLTSLLRQ